MARAIHGVSNFGDAACDAGGGFTVNYHHGFETMIFVVRQTRFNIGRHCATAPVAVEVFHLDTEIFSYLAPEPREVAGLEHQYAVARRECVDESRFPSAGPGARVNYNVTFRLKDRAQGF